MQYAVRLINGQRILIGPGLFLMHGTVDLIVPSPSRFGRSWTSTPRLGSPDAVAS